MKSYRKELWFNAPTRMHFINITPDIRECLAESGIKEGLVTLAMDTKHSIIKCVCTIIMGHIR